MEIQSLESAGHCGCSGCVCSAALLRGEGNNAGWEKGWALPLALLCTSGQRSWTGNPVPCLESSGVESVLERSAGRELKGMQSYFSIILQCVGWHCPAVAVRFSYYSFIRHCCAAPEVLHPHVCVSCKAQEEMQWGCLCWTSSTRLVHVPYCELPGAGNVLMGLIYRAGLLRQGV